MSATAPADLCPSELPGRGCRGHGDKVLWMAVVQQALDDLDYEPYGSQLHASATAFFLRGDDWAASRAAIADQIELHPDDLRRAALRHIAERQARDPAPAPRPPGVTARPPACRAVATTVERPACSNPPPVPPSRCTPPPPSRAQPPRPVASGFQFDPWRRLAREAQR